MWLQPHIWILTRCAGVHLRAAGRIWRFPVVHATIIPPAIAIELLERKLCLETVSHSCATERGLSAATGAAFRVGFTSRWPLECSDSSGWVQGVPQNHQPMPPSRGIRLGVSGASYRPSSSNSDSTIRPHSICVARIVRYIQLLPYFSQGGPGWLSRLATDAIPVRWAKATNIGIRTGRATDDCRDDEFTDGYLNFVDDQPGRRVVAENDRGPSSADDGDHRQIRPYVPR